MFQFSLLKFQSAMGLLASILFLVIGFLVVVFALRYNPRPEEGDTKNPPALRNEFRKLSVWYLVLGALAVAFSILSPLFELPNSLWLSVVLALISVLMLALFFACLRRTYLFVHHATTLAYQETLPGKVAGGASVDAKIVRADGTVEDLGRIAGEKGGPSDEASRAKT